MESHEEWWHCYGKMDIDAEMTNPDEVLALREYLEGITVPSEAAKRIMDLREDKIPVDGNWDKGLRISWFLWEAALEFTKKQPAIVDLVDAIRAMPELEMTAEQRQRLGGKWVKWRDLQDYDMIYMDAYNSMAYRVVSSRKT